MTVAVGQDLFAKCGKCGPEWHVVVAMEEATVKKVQCKQCMGYHRYKAPPGEVDVNLKAKPAKRTTVTTVKKPRSSTGAKTSSRRSSKSSPVIEPDLSLPVRTYRVRERYEPGERIEHPKFGQGVVESVPDTGKMIVFFEEGRKTLIQGRASV